MLDLKYSRETFPQTPVRCSSGQSKIDAQLFLLFFFQTTFKGGKIPYYLSPCTCSGFDFFPIVSNGMTAEWETALFTFPR